MQYQKEIHPLVCADVAVVAAAVAVDVDGIKQHNRSIPVSVSFESLIICLARIEIIGWQMDQ